MKNLTRKNMRKFNIIVIVAILFGLNACSDDFPQPSIGRYCGSPKDCKPPTEDVDISNNAWDSFTEEEKKEIQQKAEELSGSQTAQKEQSEPEMVGGFSKSWHNQMRAQAEDAAKEEHSFDLPEGWNWIQPGTDKAGPYNPDVYEDFPWPIIWEYRKFEGTEKEARDEIYEAYANGEEIEVDETLTLKPEFKEMEIAGAKVYAAMLPSSFFWGKYTTKFAVIKNGEIYQFMIEDTVDQYINEMTTVISSLK